MKTKTYINALFAQSFGDFENDMLRLGDRLALLKEEMAVQLACHEDED